MATEDQDIRPEGIMVVHPKYDPEANFKQEVVKYNENGLRLSAAHDKRKEKQFKLSQYRLKELGYDPIKELVKQADNLKREIKRQEDIRDGRRVFVRPDGKEERYNYDFHMRLLDKVQDVSVELLRYGYGRVSETLNLNSDAPAFALQVVLTEKFER
jgi:hypothetical protein